MAKTEEIRLFLSARKHVAEANLCDSLARSSPDMSLRDSATSDYVSAVDALLADMNALEGLGVLMRLEAYLREA